MHMPFSLPLAPPIPLPLNSPPNTALPNLFHNHMPLAPQTPSPHVDIPQYRVSLPNITCSSIWRSYFIGVCTPPQWVPFPQLTCSSMLGYLFMGTCPLLTSSSSIGCAKWATQRAGVLVATSSGY